MWISKSRRSSSVRGAASSIRPRLPIISSLANSFWAMTPCWTNEILVRRGDISRPMLPLFGGSRLLRAELEDRKHIGGGPLLGAMWIRRAIDDHQSDRAARFLDACLPPGARRSRLFVQHRQAIAILRSGDDQGQGILHWRKRHAHRLGGMQSVRHGPGTLDRVGYEDDRDQLPMLFERISRRHDELGTLRELMVAVPANRHEGDRALAFLQEVHSDLAHHRHKSIVIGVMRLENGPVAAAHATRQLELAGDLGVRRATHGVQADARRNCRSVGRRPGTRNPPSMS